MININELDNHKIELSRDGLWRADLIAFRSLPFDDDNEEVIDSLSTETVKELVLLVDKKGWYNILYNNK